MNRNEALFCALLAALCLLIYGQTLMHNFVNYDDGLYVTDNPYVQAGLSLKGVAWAFTTERAMYFHPLTWLSHMLDCEIFGLMPWGHHLGNLVLHALNSALLYLVLARATGRAWASACAAAFLAVHPLHVESVAWVSERKDVLSMFFWIAAMGCYTLYRQQRRARWYIATAAMFLLGFMSKPMVVTLPFALVLLDIWPFRTIDFNASFKELARQIWRSVYEKLPLFALTIAMCAVTIIMQSRGDNLAFGAKVPPLWRCANAIVVYVIYLVKTVCPLGLAPYYPHPITRPLWQVAGAAVILLFITLIALREARRRPYLIAGWFWYLGTLLPVIELVQAGSFSHADRYTYIPHIGIVIIAAWGLEEIGSKLRLPKTALASAMVAALAVCAMVQTHYWKDSATLFGHALDVTRENPVAHNNRGAGLFDLGKRTEAIEEYKKALALNPEFSLAIDNIGVGYFVEGKYDEAIAEHRKALALNPKLASGHNNLGRALAKKKDFDAAAEEFKAALGISADFMGAWCNLGETRATQGENDKAQKAYAAALDLNPKSKPANLGMAELLIAQGDAAGAAACYERALKTGPWDAETLYNYANVLQALGRKAEAAQCFVDALVLNPALVQAENNLGNLYLGAQRFDDAIRHFSKAVVLDPGFAQAHNNLGNAFAGKGQPTEAREQYLSALQIDPNYASARLNLANLLVQSGKPQDALEQLDLLLQHDPANAAALAFKAQIEGKKPGSL